ncbi:MAG: HAMP domain-containing histidine kinase [Ruminococcaceae bacterium]|nr:HAMP domain-containing histidine kinase [Oscillospiraceae bacterium]
MNSITKRWIKGSLLIIIVLLIIAEVFLSTSLRNSYYSEVETALTNRINTIDGTMSAYGNMSQQDKEKLLFNLTYDFAETDKFELMLLDENGYLLATSSGFAPSSTQHITDFQLAADSTEDIFTNSYVSSMDEKIVSATFVLEENAGEVYAVRIVTSVTRVDEEIYILIAFSIIVAFAIVAFSVISGAFFIRSIVMPVNSIKDTADKIAQGEFNVRIEHNKRYDKELSELCDSINHMAYELGRSDELKNEFISSVSHELRTPLTAIKGWAETMSGTQDMETLEKGTEIILKETDRLYSMVENLLDFSRLQNASLALSKEKLDLVAEVYDAVLMFIPQAAAKNVTIEFEEPEIFLPVMADKSKIKQVMVNLLDNALKYSDENSVIEVNIWNDKSRNTATVEVKDYGKGIRPEDIGNVKQKFYKGKGAKRGSGIGLALVNEIVKLHGGSFDIESEYKKYTSMRVTLKTVRTMKGK